VPSGPSTSRSTRRTWSPTRVWSRCWRWPGGPAFPDLVAGQVSIVGAANAAGANPVAKVMSLVAGMSAGADSIADLDRLRQTGNQLLFAGTRAPSTLGTFLRAFTHGHVQQLNAVLREHLVALCARVDLLPGADQLVFVDLDSTHVRHEALLFEWR